MDYKYIIKVFEHMKETTESEKRKKTADKAIQILEERYEHKDQTESNDKNNC